MDVISNIGKGPYFCLYKARRGTKFVVLKTPVRQETLYRELLRREYELGSTLSHPCVVDILAFLPDTPVGPALVMEYIGGETLEAFVAKNPSRQKRRKVLDDLLSGIEYLHKRGVLHNDLKPSNVMVTPGGDAKIIDLGFSISDDSVYHGVRGGSEGFSAPEVMRGEGPSGAASDIYSIGAIMKYLSVAPRHVIEKCMRSHPADRYESVSDLRKSLSIRRWLPVCMTVVAAAATAIMIMFLRPDKPHSDPSAYLDQRYEQVMESISSHPYYEWAVIEKGDFLEEMYSYVAGLTYEEQMALTDICSGYIHALDSILMAMPRIDALPSDQQSSAWEAVNERCDIVY